MDKQVHTGKISFINIEKGFATIEYLHNNKLKSVNFRTDIARSGKKPQQFRIGDGVSFELRLSDRGDKLTASQVKFTHNTGIDLLIQKAAFENRFTGYLKLIGDNYFVKEQDSYILFPLQLSAWESPPAESAINQAISFSLVNLDKPTSIVAELFSHNYIPEYKKALQHFKNEIDIDAVVRRVSPYAVYLDLFEDKVQAKLPISAIGQKQVKEGDILPVLITHFTPERIVVKMIDRS